MRWDRLFDELEGQAHDIELEERDAFADELRDGTWAETPWRRMLGGRVALAVRGAERVEGEVILVNDHVVHLRGDGFEHIVSASAVLTVLSTERRSEAPSVVRSALGWRHVLRALRGAGEEVRVHLVDGAARDGLVRVVGHDFVQLRVPSGRDQIVPFSSIAVVSGRT
ncbi:hypothetical protein [Aeromicrobium sp.]|uniref:hypothetical protein n=1 Tax=Aeromicrobium sp. TaxID=1871063 RepID=UPI003C32ECE5